MACNGNWLVMGCEAGVAWAQVGQELMQLNTEDVMQVGLVPNDHALLLHSSSLSINSVVAVLLDCQNNLSFHLLSSLTTASTSSPIANLQLPIPACPYSSPRVAISDLALA